MIPFVRPRFFLFVLPPLALLGAHGMARSRGWGIAAGLALAVASGASMAAAYAPYDQPTEDLAPIAEALREHSRQGDAVIGTYIWQEGILRLQAPRAPVRYMLGWFEAERLPQQIEALFSVERSIWFLSYGVGPQDAANPVGSWLEWHAARALLATHPPDTLALYVTSPSLSADRARPAIFANGGALMASDVPVTAEAGDALAVSLR